MRLTKMRRTPAFASLLFLTGLLSLGACTPDPDEQAPQCPLAYLRPDAATLTRYDGRGTDLTNLVLSGRLLNINGACKGLLGHRKLTAHSQVQMVLTRGPAAKSRAFDVPYNIAIVRQGQVLQKQELVQHVVFPPNVDTVQVSGPGHRHGLPDRSRPDGAELHDLLRVRAFAGGARSQSTGA